MKKRMTVIALAIALLSGGGCDFIKHDTTAYFWSGDQHNQEQYLFINGDNSGRVPQLEGVKDDEKEKIYKDALLVNLSTGKHELELKTNNGRVLASGTLEMKKSLNSATTTVSWTGKADCKVDVVYKY